MYFCHVYAPIRYVFLPCIPAFILLGAIHHAVNVIVSCVSSPVLGLSSPATRRHRVVSAPSNVAGGTGKGSGGGDREVSMLIVEPCPALASRWNPSKVRDNTRNEFARGQKSIADPKKERRRASVVMIFETDDYTQIFGSHLVNGVGKWVDTNGEHDGYLRAYSSAHRSSMPFDLFQEILEFFLEKKFFSPVTRISRVIWRLIVRISTTHSTVRPCPS